MLQILYPLKQISGYGPAAVLINVQTTCI